MNWNGEERRSDPQGIRSDLTILLRDVGEVKEGVGRLNDTIHGNGGEPGLKTEVALNTQSRKAILKEGSNRKTNQAVVWSAVAVALIASVASIIIAIYGG